MKALIIGSNGQLGTALQATAPKGSDVVAMDIPDIDITSSLVLEYCRACMPDVIFNAAAYTAVDKAESEPDVAQAINDSGVRNLAVAAADIRARLVHVSTDFVFDGEGSTPFAPEDEASPVSVYGRTKRGGELAVLELLPELGVVVRTAWLYGATGNNFVNTMLRLMRERDEIGVVADQTGTPTWAHSLAEALWKLASVPGASGIHHWTDGGQATWLEFAQAIQREALDLGLLDRKILVHAIATEDYPTPAKRPKYSVLDCSKTRALLSYEPKNWRDNLHQMLKGMTL